MDSQWAARTFAILKRRGLLSGRQSGGAHRYGGRRQAVRAARSQAVRFDDRCVISDTAYRKRKGADPWVASTGLAERYKSYIALPWQKDLPAPQRAIFVVYDKADGNAGYGHGKDLFALSTAETGHGGSRCDLTCVFAQWMAATDYRDSYFESPEDLGTQTLRDDFLEHVADQCEVLNSAGRR